MKRFFGKVGLLLTVIGFMLLPFAHAEAMMNDGGGMGGGGGMMTAVPVKNSGGIGMMGGMGGTPVVGDDGTAYLITFNPTAPVSTAPTPRSFRSRLVAITTAGTQTSINLRGILSKPVISGTTLIGSASLPDFTNYNVIYDHGANPDNQQSALYFLALPLTSTSTPQAVALDGRYASSPVLANNLIYVVTTDFGRAMMQDNYTFQHMFDGYNFNPAGIAKTYLYVLNLDGTLVSKTVIE